MSDRYKNQMCRDYLMHVYIPSQQQINSQARAAQNQGMDAALKSAKAKADAWDDAYHQSPEYKEWKKFYNKEYYQSHKDYWVLRAKRALNSLKDRARTGANQAKGLYGKYANAAGKIGERAWSLQNRVLGPSKTRQKANTLGKQFQAHNEMLLDNLRNNRNDNYRSLDNMQAIKRAMNRQKYYH